MAVKQEWIHERNKLKKKELINELINIIPKSKYTKYTHRNIHCKNIYLFLKHRKIQLIFLFIRRFLKYLNKIFKPIPRYNETILNLKLLFLYLETCLMILYLLYNNLVM